MLSPALEVPAGSRTSSSSHRLVLAVASTIQIHLSGFSTPYVVNGTRLPWEKAVEPTGKASTDGRELVACRFTGAELVKLLRYVVQHGNRPLLATKGEYWIHPSHEGETPAEVPFAVIETVLGREPKGRSYSVTGYLNPKGDGSYGLLLKVWRKQPGGVHKNYPKGLENGELRFKGGLWVYMAPERAK